MKVRGAGHAGNGMAETDGIRIVLDRYSRLLDVDREQGHITVQAGITFGNLHKLLGGWGVQLDEPGGPPGQTVGGALSTGSRGRVGRVAGLDVICADGSVLSCSAGQHRDVFDAARVGLGALGVISTVTLQVGPGFNLRSATEVARVDRVLERFDDYVDGNDYVEFVLVPATGVAVVNTRNRTDEPSGRRTRSYVDRGYRVPPGPLAGWPRVSMEYSIPLDQVTAVATRIRHPLRIVVRPADDLPMSPAYGRPSAFVGARASPGFEAVMDEVGGRPNWGLMHQQTAATLRPRYPRWDAWQAVRRRLDPDGRFANDYTDRVLG